MANVVQANLLAALTLKPVRHEVFNVAVGTTTSLNTLYKQLVHEVGKSSRASSKDIPGAEYLPFRPGDIRNSLADISKAKNELEYAPAFTLEDGLAITVPSFLENLAFLETLAGSD